MHGMYIRILSYLSRTNTVTRMSAINVSIPNLTVARLQQFRPTAAYNAFNASEQQM